MRQPVSLAGALQVVAQQQQHVVAALAQRRHRDLDDVQPVVQILAELPALDLLAQVAVGRRDQRTSVRPVTESEPIG